MQEGQAFRLRFKIANAAELKADEVVPVSAVFEKSGGGMRTSVVSWSGNDFLIDAPSSSISYTGNLKLLRITCQSAHGEREIWP